MGNTASRSVGVDTVRVIAIVAIVAGHAWTRDRSALVVYPWHVPLFFILSGYLWSGRRSLDQEARRRLETLGRPYLFWLLVLIASNAHRPWPGGERPGHRGAPRRGRSTAALHDVLVRLGPSGDRALFAVLQHAPSWIRWTLTSLGASLGWVAGEFLASTPWSAGMAVACVIYLQIGTWFREVRPRLTRSARWGLLALIVGYAPVVAGWAQPLDLKVGDFGTPVMSLVVSLLISAGLILCTDAFAVRLPHAVAAWVTQCALAGLTVVLAHPLFLWAPRPWPAFVLGILIPGIIGMIALRTPLSPWITGQDRLTRTGPPCVPATSADPAHSGEEQPEDALGSR